MAEKVTLVDDLDGSEKSIQRLTFGIDGEHFEIDLSDKNADELRTAVAPYKAVARPLPTTPGVPKNKPANSPAKRQASRTIPTDREIRAWAKKKRVKVNATGIVSNDVRAKYLAAHH